jgi:hypothetical protein
MSLLVESRAPASADPAVSTVPPVSTKSGQRLLLFGSAALIISGAAFTASPINAFMMAVILVCSAISTIAGFAFSALAGAVLFQMHSDPVYVVGVLLISSIARAVYTVWSIRSRIEWVELMPYLLGASLVFPRAYTCFFTLAQKFTCFRLAASLYATERTP